MFGRSFALGVAFGFATAVIAQEAGPSASTPKRVAVTTIPALADDVETIDGIVKAYYGVISGPAGRPREWARDRTLYLPGVRFAEIGEAKDGAARLRVESHQEYVDRTDPTLVREGFDEREIHRVTERFGSIANVFSTYESRRIANGPVVARGINSLQLVHDGKRWWIAGAAWQDESALNPIPTQFLPSEKTESHGRGRGSTD